MANYTQIKGMTAYDSDNNKVGTIADLYYDEDASAPTWATITTGLFGNKVHFVPLRMAEQVEDGVKLSVTEAQVKDAPSIDVDDELPESDEERLYEHYNMNGENSSREDSSDHDRQADDHEVRDGERDSELAGSGVAGGQTSGSDADRSANERDRANDGRTGGQSAQGGQGGKAGHMRLKKYIVTENVQVTVPVQREVVELEGEDGEIDQANTGEGRQQ